MFVVDRVELRLFNQSQEVRKLHAQDAVFSQNEAKPADKVIDIRDMGQNVVPDQQVAEATFIAQAFGQRDAEEFVNRVDACCARNFGNITRRLNAKDGNVAFFEILQQVAIVTRHLDDQRVGIEAEAFADIVYKLAGMGQPAC